MSSHFPGHLNHTAALLSMVSSPALASDSEHSQDKTLMKTMICRIIALFVGAALPLAVAWPQEPPKAPMLISIDAGLPQDEWRLPTTHFVRAKMPMTLVHPRPDNETNAWARHRKAYPGLEYRIPVAVQGGAYPFYYEIVEAPEGMTIGKTVWETDYGVLSWTPEIGENGRSFPVTIRIYGQEYGREVAETVGPTFVDAKFVIKVTNSTDDFIFVDHSVERSGDGSISAPLKTLKETYGDGSSTQVTYPGRAVYLRAGVYETLTDDWFANKGYAHLQGERTPMVFLGFPSEMVEIDFTNGTFYSEIGGNDHYVAGLRLSNTSQRARGYHGNSEYVPVGSRQFTIGQERQTFFENHFIASRTQYLDYAQVFSFERVSDSQFKVVNADATVAFSSNSYQRIYTDSRDYTSVRIRSSSFDGKDTYVTVYLDSGDPPFLPANIETIKRRYTGGNEGFVNSRRSTFNKKYLAFWGNHYDDWQVGPNGSEAGHAIGSLYMHRYVVIEGETVGYGEGSSAILLKASIGESSVRRTSILEGRPVWGLIVGLFEESAPGEPDMRVRAEFCYNRLKATTVDKQTLRILSGATDIGTVDDMSAVWVYRNTFVGGPQKPDFYKNATATFESNLIYTDRSPPYLGTNNLMIDGDVLKSYGAHVTELDASLNTIGDFRGSYLGTHGAEIAGAR